MQLNLGKRWELALGADYLHLGDYTVHGGTNVAEFDFSRGIAAHATVAWRF